MWLCAMTFELYRMTPDRLVDYKFFSVLTLSTR
jgi:hypothetical protein